MNPVENNVLHLLHVASVILLAAYTFYAFAAPPETRKSVMIWTGVTTLIVLLTGIRMWQAMYSFSLLGWVMVKLVCWLGLSALAGMAYRKRERTALLMSIGVGLVVVAVAMVYLKPF